MKKLQSCIGPRAKRAAALFVGVLMTSTLFLTSSARATVVWTFENAVFQDGTTLTGDFTIDNSDSIVASDISVGDSPPFFADVFDMGASFEGRAVGYQFSDALIFQQLRLNFFPALTPPPTGGTLPLSSFSLEEWIPDPLHSDQFISRTLGTGELVGVTVPEAPVSTMLGVLLCLCLVFSRWLRFFAPVRF